MLHTMGCRTDSHVSPFSWKNLGKQVTGCLRSWYSFGKPGRFMLMHSRLWVLSWLKGTPSIQRPRANTSVKRNWLRNSLKCSLKSTLARQSLLLKCQDVFGLIDQQHRMYHLMWQVVGYPHRLDCARLRIPAPDFCLVKASAKDYSEELFAEGLGGNSWIPPTFPSLRRVQCLRVLHGETTFRLSCRRRPRLGRGPWHLL